MTARSYHHGDLRNALLAATMELVGERGARGFSVSEAARRAGVSISAPYRHFADRDAMLAAAAQSGFAELETRLRDLAATLGVEQTFGACAAQLAVLYVDFALENPPRFEVMFAPGLEKATQPELLEQTVDVQSLLELALAPHLEREQLSSRAAELWALAHGVATLSIGGGLGHAIGDASPGDIVARAARSWSSGVADDAALARKG
ncbi:TetR/AcrR family transcriptional regulator [Agreia sp.]|uniref:TetR/AcrR family transcriptional regulator n=1 Tax=Agreia sp. TaxID=1872416 RepID=UPI0035BC0A60